MKSTLTFIAFVAICSSMMFSCKNNNKKTQNQQPTQEEIQNMKQTLADSVLADIDAFAEQYFDTASDNFRFRFFELTDAEKKVKPDYLLDPSAANTFVTKTQKINALAIYTVEIGIRQLYEMPMEETKEAIAKLAAEVNHPIDAEFMVGVAKPSEKVKKEYEICKERGDLTYFWQFQNAIMAETGFIFAQNPELFFSKITEEQWQGFLNRSRSKNKALAELSQYDDEIAAIMDIRTKYKAASSSDEFIEANKTIESAKQFRIANRDKYINRRNALLQ